MSDTPRTNFVAHETGDAEWDRSMNRFGRMMAHACILERELTTAQAKIAMLRTDAERLDWLDTVDCGINHIGYEEYRDYIGRGFIKKIREVVDAAMKDTTV
jgi:hypothetical protein